MRTALTVALAAGLVTGCGRSRDAESRPTGDTARVAVVGAPVRSGVLLGVAGFEGGYETLWIAGDGDSVAVLARGPGLLVPRSDGFWWVEQPADCAYVAAGPADGWLARSVAHGHDWSGPIPESCPDDSRMEILYLDQDHLAVRSWGDAPSGRAADSWDERYVMSLDSLTGRQALPLERFVAESRLHQLDRLADATADSLRRTSGEECRWSRASGWALGRENGRWGLVAYYEPSVLGCDRFALAVPGDVPAELVRHNTLSPGWAAIRAALPAVRDAVSSPGGDLVIAYDDDALYAFRVAGDTLGSRTPLGAAPGRLVMAEWALGRHVARWTDAVRPLLQQSSREPSPDGR